MVTVFGDMIVSVRGGGSGDSSTAIRIRNELPDLLRELAPKELDSLRVFLDVRHRAIVLQNDDSIEDALIVDAGSGVLRFPSRLAQFLDRKHSNEAKAKLQDMLRPLLKGMVKQAADHSAEVAASAKAIAQASADARAERERLREEALQENPFYLIAKLTERVEKLEAKR